MRSDQIELRSLTLLFAPRPGREVRRQLRERVDGLRERVRERIATPSGRVSEAEAC